jgi:predicted secreted protein
MAKAHGKGSSLTFTNLTVGDASFTITDNIDVADVTDFADGASGFRKYIAGLRDWDVTVTGLWDSTPNTAAVGDEATLTLTLGSAKTFAGNAILISQNVVSAVGDAITHEWTFKGNGALTEPA